MLTCGIRRLIREFVIACGAAGLAVHEAVLTNANFEHSLAETTVFFALALGFGQFTLCAAVFGGAGSGGHNSNVALGGEGENVPLVTWRLGYWLKNRAGSSESLPQRLKPHSVLPELWD